jgi:hypothetical protein
MGVIPAIEAVRVPETPIPLEKFASKYHGFDRILGTPASSARPSCNGHIRSLRGKLKIEGIIFLQSVWIFHNY